MEVSYHEENLHWELDSMNEEDWNKVLDSFMMYPV
jgi:hypothetical protein